MLERFFDRSLLGRGSETGGTAGAGAGAPIVEEEEAGGYTNHIRAGGRLRVARDDPANPKRGHRCRGQALVQARNLVLAIANSLLRSRVLI